MAVEPRAHKQDLFKSKGGLTAYRKAKATDADLPKTTPSEKTMAKPVTSKAPKGKKDHADGYAGAHPVAVKAAAKKRGPRPKFTGKSIADLRTFVSQNQGKLSGSVTEGEYC